MADYYLTEQEALDWFIAEELFGWHHLSKGQQWNYVRGRPLIWGGNPGERPLYYALPPEDVTDHPKEPDAFRANWQRWPEYSSSIHKALTALDRLRIEGWEVAMTTVGYPNIDWEVIVWYAPDGKREGKFVGPDLARAICEAIRAAMLTPIRK